MVTSLHAGGEIHHTFLQEPYLNACYILICFCGCFPLFSLFLALNSLSCLSLKDSFCRTTGASIDRSYPFTLAESLFYDASRR